MSTPGRKRTPTAIVKLRGNPGHRRLPSAEPRPQPEIPACPPHIQGEARKEWRRITKQLGTLGLITGVDRAALAVYCQSWGRWTEAEENVRKYGVLIKTPEGYPIVSPHLTVANKAMALMLRVLTEFGMTPSSRTRVRTEKSNKPDEAEQFLFGAQSKVTGDGETVQ